MKFGWFGNREQFFNNFQYTKNALVNSHFPFFKQLIEDGHEIYYLGVSKKSNKGKSYRFHERIKANMIDLDKRFTLSLTEIKTVSTEWQKKISGFDEIDISKILDDKFFPEVDLDVIWVDSMFYNFSLGDGYRLKSLLLKYPKAQVYLYDESGDSMSTMFEHTQLKFTKEDLKRIVVLTTYSNLTNFSKHEFRNIVPYFYSLQKNQIDPNKNPQYDGIYCGRIFGLLLIERLKFLRRIFEAANENGNFKIITDFNISSSNWKGAQLVDFDLKNPTHYWIATREFTMGVLLKTYQNIIFDLNYLLPCNIYREYNNAYCTLIPLSNSRVKNGLISLRPWETVTAGIIPIYTAEFYGWENFTKFDYIISDENPCVEIMKKIKAMTFKQRKQEIEEHREKFSKYTVENRIKYFYGLMSEY